MLTCPGYIPVEICLSQKIDQDRTILLHLFLDQRTVRLCPAHVGLDPNQHWVYCVQMFYQLDLMNCSAIGRF